MTTRRRKFSRWVAAAGLTVAIALASIPVLTAHAVAAETLRIGSFLAITGRSSFLGAPALATLRQWIDLINEQGGVAGRRLELFYYDTGIDTRAAQTAVRRLINIDKVHLIIGGSTASASISVIPTVEEAGIPFISISGSAAITDPVRKWVFKTGFSDRLACGRILADMRQRKVRRIAMISENEGLGHSMREQCMALAPRVGITVVQDETYTAGSRRVAAQLSRIKRLTGSAGGIDAVLVAGFGSGPVHLTRTYKSSGINVPLYHSHGVSLADLLERAGKAAEGVRMPVSLLDVADRLPRGDSYRAVLDRYRIPFEKRWGVPATIFGGFAYDALQIALGAVHRARGVDPAAIRREIERTNGYRGVTGIYRMSASNHGGLDLDAFRMIEIIGGDWVIVN